MGDSDEEDNTKEHQLKVVLLGDGTSGKTSIITRFCQSNFDRTYNQTIGLDFFLQRIILPGDHHVTLQVWDIGGQTMGGNMLDKYVSGAHIILFVYDITNHSSFENLEDWYSTVESCLLKSDSPTPKLAVVGNKIDLEHSRVVKKDKHLKFAQNHNMSSFFVSAKSNDQVYNCFKKMAAESLGVRLTTADIEATATIVKADIVKYSNTPKQVTNQKSTSSICSLQ